jgi:hypothetical protein
MSVTTDPARADARFDAVGVPLAEALPIGEPVDVPFATTSTSPPAATVPATAGLRS